MQPKQFGLRDWFPVRSSAAWYSAIDQSAHLQACFRPYSSRLRDSPSGRCPIGAGDSPAREVVPSLSYRHVAYLRFRARRNSFPPAKITREAGAAACGTNVLGPAGCLNRTFVLLFPKCHLTVTLPREPMRGRLEERFGNGRLIERLNETHPTTIGWCGKV